MFHTVVLAPVVPTPLFVLVMPMARVRRLVLLIVLVAVAAALYRYSQQPPSSLVLSGLVTTNDVIVSPQIAGQIGELMVKEGDHVTKDQRLAVITPDELKADTAYYTQAAAGVSAQVRESQASLRFEQRQTAHQIAQAESMLASTDAQVTAATA